MKSFDPLATRNWLNHALANAANECERIAAEIALRMLDLHKCEDCGAVNGTVYDITRLSPYPVPSEYCCDGCAEIRWDAQQKREFE